MNSAEEFRKWCDKTITEVLGADISAEERAIAHRFLFACNITCETPKEHLAEGMKKISLSNETRAVKKYYKMFHPECCCDNNSTHVLTSS